MNCENLVVSLETGTTSEKKNNVSLLQGDDIFFNRLLTRDSSKGSSSRIYYRSTEGVPFKWESEPGTPINPTTHESLPPLSPPPAALISSMFAPPPPCLTECNRTKGLSWSRVKFWKKSRHSNRSKKQMVHSSPDLANFDQVENFEFWSSDCESVLSDNRSRSSSSSSSSLHCSSPPSPKMFTPRTPQNFPRSSLGVSHGFICTPWNFGGFVGSSPRGA